MQYLIIIPYYIISILFILYCYKKYYVSPVGIFCFFQLIMFTGLIKILDFHKYIDLKHILIYLLGLIGVILGNFLPFNTRKKNIYIKKKPKNMDMRILGLLLLSFILISVFFYKVGFNFFSENSFNISEYRKKVNFSFGSGYIYQFRIFIFPFLVLYSINFGKGIIKKVSYIMFPFMFYFLVASGQRAGLVTALLMYLTAIFLLHHYKVKNMFHNKSLFFLMGLTFIFFFILTFMNNRVTISGSFLKALRDRILLDNQMAATLSFHYISKLPTQFGKDWGNLFLDILPGKNSYISIAQLIHASLYGGSLEGTSPPDLWGSIYYNFNLLGVIFISILIGYYYKKIYLKFILGKKTPYHIFIYSYLFLSMGMWIADSPMYFFNDGFITLLILNFCLTYKLKLT